MQRFRRLVMHLPVINIIVLFSYRSLIAIQYLFHKTKLLTVWLFTSRESTNFTYNLTATNKRYLASLIADILEKPCVEIEGYIKELETDSDLHDHISSSVSKRRDKVNIDSDVRFCRRLGWYAIARAIKPKIIVETGIDKGLGSCVLTAALIKNAEEGFPGYYYGTDINPEAGYLFTGKYKNFGEILYGDSITSLELLDKKIDLFINDSDHSAEYEKREYETISGKLSSAAIILGDNSCVTDKLLDFALQTQRHFILFNEMPEKSWYPGDGIGIAFRRNTLK
jgi:hypothetical protein